MDLIQQNTAVKFKAERISKSSTIELNDSVEKVFPLFGPVLEKEWAEGWDPEIIYSITNLVEEYMIFRTKASNNSEEHFTWVITQYRPERHFIEYTVSTWQRLWFVRVECLEVQSKTKATISYTYTGFTTLGNQLNRTAIEKMFAHDLKDWEKAINYYLKTGKQLSGQ